MYSIEIKENTEKGALHVTVRIKKTSDQEKKRCGIAFFAYFFFSFVVNVRDKQCHHCATFQ